MSITSCEGSRKYGTTIYIDFHAISRPCTCTALLSFEGVLSITLASEEISYDCGTEIYVNNSHTTFLFPCPISLPASNFLNVQINQSVDIRAKYALPSIGTFYHCLRFQQNGKYIYIQKQHNYAFTVSAFSSRECITFFYSYCPSNKIIASFFISIFTELIDPLFSFCLMIICLIFFPNIAVLF